MATNTKLDSLVINYLTQSQYDTAKNNGTLNANQIYMTPASTSTYTLPTATSSTLGGVKIGSNITVSSGTISLTKTNVTSALGYTPPTTDTKYTLPSATSSTLGGVMLSDSTSSTSGASSGVAATPAAVKAAYDFSSQWVTYNASGIAAIFTANSIVSKVACYGRAKKIFLTIGGKSSATSGASGLIDIGTIGSGYRPQIDITCAVCYNGTTSGQIYAPATCIIKTTGAVQLITGKVNTTFGNSSYPWTTTTAMCISWDY